MLAMIIFMLGLFKFPVTLNSFTRFPSYTNFIFTTVSCRSSSSCCYSLAAAGPCCCSSSSLAAAGSCCYSSSSASSSTMSFNFSCPYPIFSTILSNILSNFDNFMDTLKQSLSRYFKVITYQCLIKSAIFCAWLTSTTSRRSSIRGTFWHESLSFSSQVNLSSSTDWTPWCARVSLSVQS